MRFAPLPAGIYEASLSLTLHRASRDLIVSIAEEIGASEKLLSARYVEHDEGETLVWEWRHQVEAAPWPGNYAIVFARIGKDDGVLHINIHATYDSLAIAAVCRVMARFLDAHPEGFVEATLWMNADGVYAGLMTLPRALLRELLDNPHIEMDDAFDGEWPSRTQWFEVVWRGPGELFFQRRVPDPEVEDEEADTDEL